MKAIARGESVQIERSNDHRDYNGRGKDPGLFQRVKFIFPDLTERACALRPLKISELGKRTSRQPTEVSFIGILPER